MTIPCDRNYASLKQFQHGEVERFNLDMLKSWQCKRQRICVGSVFFSYVQNEILSTKNNIVFCLGNSFPIMLSVSLAQVLYITRQHYKKTVLSGKDNDRIICILSCFLKKIMQWNQWRFWFQLFFLNLEKYSRQIRTTEYLVLSFIEIRTHVVNIICKTTGVILYCLRSPRPKKKNHLKIFWWNQCQIQPSLALWSIVYLQKFIGQSCAPSNDDWL